MSFEIPNKQRHYLNLVNQQIAMSSHLFIRPKVPSASYGVFLRVMCLLMSLAILVLYYLRKQF